MMKMTDPPGGGPQKAQELQLSEEERQTMTLLMTTRRRRKRRGRPGGAGELCRTMIMKTSQKRSPANGPEGREVAGALHPTMILTARKSDQRGGRWSGGRGRGCRMRMKTTTRWQGRGGSARAPAAESSRTTSARCQGDAPNVQQHRNEAAMVSLFSLA